MTTHDMREAVFLVDASGNEAPIAAGVAGTPAGGVQSVQGVSGGKPLPAAIFNSLGQENSDSNPVYVKAYSGDGTASLLGAVDETAPATDTASSGLNGRLQRVAQRLSAIIGTVAAGTAATASMLAGAVYRSTTLTLTDGQQASLTMGSHGSLMAQLMIPDSNSAIGTTVNGADGVSNSVSGLRVFSFNVRFNGSQWDRVYNALPYSLLLANTTNLQTVKNAAGRLHGGVFSNKSATAFYVKIYNKASNATLASDTPVMRVFVPAGATVSFGIPEGAYYGTGIAIAVVQGVADTDTTAPAANDGLVNLMYS